MTQWYRIGTINLTNGSPIVTGIGTVWSGANTHQGDILIAPDGLLYEILSVDSSTQLQIKPISSAQTGYQGATDISGTAKYAIAPLVGSTTTASLAQRVSTLLTQWQDRQDELSDWQGGSATGGTNGDGRYPLTDSLGNTELVMSPAKTLEVVGNLDVELVVASAKALEATQSAAAALVSKNSASGSASTASSASGTAVAAKDTTLLARDTAVAQAGIATTKAGEASGSASAALVSQGLANTSAIAAAASALESATNVDNVSGVYNSITLLLTADLQDYGDLGTAEANDDYGAII